MNRRNLMIGTAIFGPLVLVVDALLGTAAGLVSSSLRVGLMVGGGMALISCLELAVVAWAAKVRQDREAGI